MFIYVGTMDGYTDRGYSSFEDMGICPSASEDELDIVGEAIMDKSSDEEQLAIPTPSVTHSPIVECARLSRAS
jgi:hypothetical protein